MSDVVWPSDLEDYQEKTTLLSIRIRSKQQKWSDGIVNRYPQSASLNTILNSK